MRALLRVAAYVDARREGEAIGQADPDNPTAIALHGDGLWGAGLFEEAEALYARALALDPGHARARHGRARSRAAQYAPVEALDDVLFATKADPGEALYWVTLATIHEQMRRYRDAAAALDRYVTLLPRAGSDPIAMSARAHADFLRSFGTRVPYDGIDATRTYVVPFKVVNGDIVVRGILNRGTAVDLIVDTGADRVALQTRTAQRARVVPIARIETAGVGELARGFRPMVTARIDELQIGPLRVQNVGCLIKDPALPTLPTPEGEVFSPLALGLSMHVDYARHELTMARRLPDAPSEITLPMRMSRLAVVRGVINGSSAVGFVVDTGGEATSVNHSVAALMLPPADVRRVPARVYGVAGWDANAFLLPFVDIKFAPGVGLERTSVVVLNLDAPSALMGFQIGGIVGHHFLSRYTVTIDLMRSRVGLTRNAS
jgi:hypothetical protein